MVGDNAPEPMSTADQGNSPTPQLATEPEPASSERAFPGGFDPKMAVLYSEILKPRF